MPAGAGSVVGDTTTTMMWLDGVSPLDVLHAYVASLAAFFVFAIPAARQQQRYSPITQRFRRRCPGRLGARDHRGVDPGRRHRGQYHANSLSAEESPAFPYIGATVFGVLLLLTPWRRPDWNVVPEAPQGQCVPAVAGVVGLDDAGRRAAGRLAANDLGLGFVSAVFDNIPLTKLALEQGGYDWGVLAYAVGFGGSMIWFGSSAGVAVSNLYPEARSVFQWVREGWHVAWGTSSASSC